MRRRGPGPSTAGSRWRSGSGVDARRPWLSSTSSVDTPPTALMEIAGEDVTNELRSAYALLRLPKNHTREPILETRTAHFREKRAEMEDCAELIIFTALGPGKMSGVGVLTDDNTQPSY